MTPHLSDLPARRAAMHPDRVALAGNNGAWNDLTYGELDTRSRGVAAALGRRGLPPGARVALLSEPRPEWAIALFGAWRAGGVVVPVNPRLTSAELTAVLDDADPTFLLASPQQAEAAVDAAAARPGVRAVLVVDAALWEADEPGDGVPRSGAETALVVYTSGTTGAPRGVLVSFTALEFETTSLARTMDLAGDDVFVSTLPLHHLLELTGGLLTPLEAGASVCYPGSVLIADVLEAAAVRHATSILTVPLWLKLFASQVAALPPSFRRFVVGGAPLEPALEELLHRRDILVLQGYGLTETGPVISAGTPSARRRGSVGRPLPGVDVKIGTDGQIWTRGPHVMSGYHRRPEETRAAIDAEGWLATGDLGRLDEDGFLYVTGRSKDWIVLGSGCKVWPEEIERLIERSLLLRESCVLGRPATSGPLAGTDEVWAVVVPRASPGPTAEDAQREVRRLTLELSAFKRPARVVVRDEPLPRSATLKLQRHRVRAWLEERA